MCGITGVVRSDGASTDRDVLDSMVAALAHRGPEAQGIDVIETPGLHVALGHTRLKIIDLSDGGAQPMTSDDGAILLTFNGEVYNYRELRASLAARGVRFRSSSDTEVLLRLYEADGDRFLESVDGMFAFALWDGRRRRLLLARDRVGKKPLFYHARPGLFAFASEIKSLVRHPEIGATVNRAALPPFFLYGYVPSPDTFYDGIRKLPPGHLLTLDDRGGVRTEPYWELPAPPPTPATRPAAAARVRELVTEAVQRRLIADVPLGAFLSGGIDSTIVVGLMARLMDQPVRTFSIGFTGDPRFDETAYARLAARAFGTAHTEFVVQPSAFGLVDRLVWHHDGPFADSSALPTYILSRMTRQHVTVALNGDGGDELFAGYLRFYGALLSERVPAWLRRAGREILGGLPEWGGHRSAFRRLQRFTESASLPLAERLIRWVSVFFEDLPRLLPDVAADGGRAASLALLAPVLRRGGSASPLGQLLHLNFETYLLDDLLVKMDRCSMAHALETRSPFLDRALIEYVATLPDALKLRGGRTKVVLREAFADLVPREILRRGKMGFGVPLRAWFSGDLRPYLEEMLLAREARLRDHVDQGYVRALCDAHARGVADHSHRLWTLLTFEVWLRNLALVAPAPTAHEGLPVGAVTP